MARNCKETGYNVKTQLIERELGYTEVNDASQGKGNLLSPGPWDLFYGGGCMGHWLFDSGLSKELTLAKLRQDQVVYPCFGGRDSYVSKIGLCKILRSIDPARCYVLPVDRQRVAAQMDGKRAWVIKLDMNPDVLTSFNANAGVWAPEGYEEEWHDSAKHHRGKSVQYVTRPDQLPHIPRSAATQAVVQRFFMPHLGQGCMRRKWELRVYTTVVSLSPPRFYYNLGWDVTVARSLYNNETAPGRVRDMCIHDTHGASLVACNLEGSCHVDVEGWPEDGTFRRDGHGLKGDGRSMTYTDFERVAQVPGSVTATLRRRVHDLLSKVFHHPTTLKGYTANPITRDIEAAGATCFRLERADFGVSAGLEPVLYEIKAFPEMSVPLPAILVAHRDLFKMLELHKPTRLPPAERAEWERQNLGTWAPITPVA